MDLAFNIALYGFALCGIWLVGLTAWRTIPKITGLLKADLSAFEARLAVLEAKLHV